MFYVLASLEYKLKKYPYYMDVPIYHIALLALSLPLPMYSLWFTILTLQIQAQTTPPYIYVLTIFIALSQMP